MHLECFSIPSNISTWSNNFVAQPSFSFLIFVSSKSGRNISGRRDAFELIIFRPRKSDHEHKEDKKESRAANIVTTNSHFNDDFWHSPMHFCCHSRPSSSRPPKWAQRNHSRRSKTCVDPKRCKLNTRRHLRILYFYNFMFFLEVPVCGSRVSVHRSSSCSNKQTKLAFSLLEINFYQKSMEFLRGMFKTIVGTCWCIAWEWKGQRVMTYVSELGCDFRMFLLILLPWLPLVLVQLLHTVTAQVLQLFGVESDLLRLVLDLVHEFPPGLEYLTSYICRRVRSMNIFDMEVEM